jgi:tRNA(adenine34) deaminase
MWTVLKRSDAYFMQKALYYAKKAALAGDTPIGAVIVYEDRVIACAYNKRNRKSSALAHAELLAIGTACKKTGDWRLDGMTLYVTLEPCPMCAGAIVQSRIKRVVIGTMSPKSGCAGSVVNLLQMQGFNHRCEVSRGVCEDECAGLLREFFGRIREIVVSDQ